MLKRLLILSFVFVLSGTAFAQSTDLATDFTYQGYLQDNGIALTDSCAMQFALFNAATGGTQIGTTQSATAVAVSNGVFNVVLDFGVASFDGIDHFLEIAVDCDSTGFTTLSPRQPLTPAPYAIALYGLRTEPNATSPNLIGGFNGNSLDTGVIGAVISGGGEAGNLNIIYDNFGTIGGGSGNIAGDEFFPGDWAVVAGGVLNTASGSYSTVSGGDSNTASGSYSTVSGGDSNRASGRDSTVSGGRSNVASQLTSTVAGGRSNTAFDTDSTVSGGNTNTASGSDSTVGGGEDNRAEGSGSTVSGGNSNVASQSNSTVGGGTSNTASGRDSTVSGGNTNTASGTSSSVGGGEDNRAEGFGSTIGGGNFNIVIGLRGTIGGGGGGFDPTDANNGSLDGNLVYGDYGTIGGGSNNTAGSSDASITSDSYATVSGGFSNTASGFVSTIAGGARNSVSGSYSFVAGGDSNFTSGNYSFVAGEAARTGGNNSFLWNDGSFRGTLGTDNRFVGISSGGVAFYTGASGTALNSNGVQLTAGGSGWIGVSDRNTKENFETVDTLSVLEALVAIPVTEWNYIAQDDEIRHMGVMAQDFDAAFGLGEDPLGINTIDMDGVTVAAIQGLYQQNQALQAQINQLQVMLLLLFGAGGWALLRRKR